MKIRRPWFFSLLAGVFFVLVYVAAATVGIPLPERLSLALVFLVAPAAILGVLAIRRWLGGVVSSPFMALGLDAGAVFLAIAFAFFDLMIIVQQTVRFFYRDLLAAENNAAAAETLRLAYRLVNPVQMGIDIAFDVFYCLGIVLVSSVMLAKGRFERITGWYGILTAAGLLAFNLWTFPKPPADSGLIDLGPATAVWWIAVIVQVSRANRKTGGD
jgi:hypothetical protein